VNELWAPAVVLGGVALVSVLTAALLAFASRRHCVTLTIRCPMLRRNLRVTGDEWEGRLLDVRRCSGLDLSTDFELCRMACVELDECTSVPLGLPGNHLVKGGRT
jgi:hypothetical protein